MSFISKLKSIDLDGLLTFFLTLLLVVVFCGIPLLLSYLHTLRISWKSRCDKSETPSLLVFGKRLIQNSIDAEYRTRLDKAAEVIGLQTNAFLILLGGTNVEGEISEAEAGFNYLLSQGIDQSTEILLEKSSQNTLENLRNARNLLIERGNEKVSLITNRYHLARCRMIAVSLGLKPTLCPAEAEPKLTLDLMKKLIMEAFYILWFSTGKIWARMTFNQRMLERVT